MPTFRCNQNCEYCYLTKKNQTVLSIPVLIKRLEELHRAYDITQINVYGGELGTLSDSYLTELFSICKKYSSNINAITNLMRPEIIDLFSEVKWSVSINEERPDYQQNVSYLLSHDHENISISQVVTPSIIKMGARKTLAFDSMLGSRVEFLRYNPTEEIKHYILYNKDFEDFLIDILKCYKNYPIKIQNLYDLKNCIEEKYNVFADSNIFLNPNGNWSSVFYCGQNELFRILSSLSDLNQIVEEEKQMLYNKSCKNCKYLGHCYAEHLHLHEKGDSCCGLKNLLKFYEENIYQDN